MKELTNKWMRALMVLMVFAALLSTSCTSDDDKEDELQGYEGKWTSNENMFSEDDSEEYKDIMTLTTTTFEDRIQKPSTADANKWEDWLVLKGTILATGNTMEVHVSEIGISFNPLTNEPTGNISYIKEGNPLFQAIVAESGQDQDFELEYSITGDTMILKTDRNGDGDNTDENESVEYTRIK